MQKNARNRIRARIKPHTRGDAATPRLAVFRSAKHIYAQVIDDLSQKTLAAASDSHIATDKTKKALTKSEKAAGVGVEIAKRAHDLNITAVRFDRGGFRFHGRIKALAEAARQNGLIF